MLSRFFYTLFIAGLLASCASQSPNWWDRPARTHAYVLVQQGETLGSIASKYQIRISELANYNGLKVQQDVPVGTLLYLPPHAMTETEEMENLRRSTEPVGMQEVHEGTWENPLSQRDKVVTVQALPAVSEKETALPTKHSTPVSSASVTPKPNAVKPVWIWPVDGTLVKDFKTQTGDIPSEGIIIKATLGAPVKAVRDGEVIYVGENVDGYGALVLLKHADHYESTYAHNQKILVKVGQSVRQGQTIALAGQSGGVDGPQLYFEIRKGLKALDPITLLPKSKL